LRKEVGGADSYNNDTVVFFVMEHSLYSFAFIIDYVDLLHRFLVIYRAATRTRQSEYVLFRQRDVIDVFGGVFFLFYAEVIETMVQHVGDIGEWCIFSED